VDCYISHGVTLGGTGKESGNRHPKIGNGVFIGAGATVLGNINVGDGAIVNAGAVVTKPVDPFTRVGGVPAKVISRFAIENPQDGSASPDAIAQISEKRYQQLETDSNLQDCFDYNRTTNTGVPKTFPSKKINYHAYNTET
jgi:serine acetyltransferase